MDNKAEQQILQKLDNVNSKNLVQSNVVGGNIKHFHENWNKITHDHVILSIIQYGFKINFTRKPQFENVDMTCWGLNNYSRLKTFCIKEPL